MCWTQIILNFRRRSTEGLSLGLILLWHASALLIYPYLIHTKEPFALQLQVGTLTLGREVRYALECLDAQHSGRKQKSMIEGRQTRCSFKHLVARVATHYIY